MMLIRQQFQSLFVALSCTMLLAVSMAGWSLSTVDELIATETRHVESLKLADELRQSSDDLTRMARSFAATGDPRFESYFNEILEIRAGEAPYPAGYQGIFWDFVVHDDARRSVGTAPTSILGRMRELGFTDEELSKLSEAEARSNALVRLETAAMNAVKGRFDDGNGNYTVSGAPDRAMAIQMLFSDDYHAAKAGIMQPVADFLDLLQARMARELAQGRSDHARQIKLATIAIALALGLTVYGYFLLNSRVVSPLTMLRSAIAAFKDSPRQSIPDFPRRDEIGAIAAQLNESSRAIADHIDHVNDARERLERSQSQLRAVLDQIPAGVYLTNAALEIEVVNDQLIEIFGFPDGFVNEGTHVAEMIRWLAERGNYPGETVDSALAKRIAALESGRLTVSEQTAPTGRSVQLTHCPTADGGVCAVILDVTDRRRAELELQENRDMFQALADNLPEFITMKDADGRFLFVNKQFEEWTTKRRDDVVGKTVFEIYDEEQARAFHALDQSVLASGEVLSDEVPLRYPDGQTRTVLRTRFPVLDASGEVLGLGTVNRDVSERKRQEQAIATQKQVLETVLENVNQGIAMFNVDHELTAWNRHYQQLLGLDDSLMTVGQPLGEIARVLAERGAYGAGDPASQVQARLAYLTDGEVRRGESSFDDRVYDVHKRPLDVGGLVITYTDITERKRNEVEMREARAAAEQALEELKRAQVSLVQSEKMASLGQLTAGIAHEIKNPLNFVNNFADTSVEMLEDLNKIVTPALERLNDSDREEATELLADLTEDLGSIASHGKRADRIMRSMLMQARGKAGELEMTDLNPLVEDAIRLAFHSARAMHSDFNIDIPTSLDESIGQIPLLAPEMTRVLVNLVENGFYAARKRAENGEDGGFSPEVSVTTLAPDEATVEIRVRDNGTGIPSAAREQIFEPFYTTKPPGEGTGLGLPLCYDIVVNGHHGALEVESEEGQFTEFVVRVPRPNSEARS